MLITPPANPAFADVVVGSCCRSADGNPICEAVDAMADTVAIVCTDRNMLADAVKGIPVPVWFDTACLAYESLSPFLETPQFVENLVSASHQEILNWESLRQDKQRGTNDRKVLHRCIMSRRRAYQNRKSAKLSATKNKSNAYAIAKLERSKVSAEVYSKSMFANYQILKRRRLDLAGFEYTFCP